jgi:hypothetical protein
MSALHRFMVAIPILCACGGAAVAEPYPIVFVARADDDLLPGVEVNIGNEPAGRTDEHGMLAVLLRGDEGELLRSSIACPTGYEIAQAPQSIQLARVRSVDHPDATRPLVIDVRCRPSERLAVVLVRAGLEGIPVQIGGSEKTRTDADGLAHVAMRVPAGSQIEVVLWTEHRPELSPASPSSVFVMPDSDELFVVEQTFAMPHQAHVATRRPRPTRQLPVRVR